MMLRFHKVENFLFMFISVHLYVSFAGKSLLVASVLAIVFTIKVWCQLHSHSSVLQPKPHLNVQRVI